MKLQIDDKKKLFEIGKHNKWIFRFASEKLKKDIEVREAYKKYIEKNKSDDGTFVVLSDFHSNRWPLDEKIPLYLKEYDKVYILGDATDRGPSGSSQQGNGGIKLLLDIMDKCKEKKDRLIYIPGNHDEFLYYYAAHRDTEIGTFMKNNLYSNHGYYTVEDIDKLREENPKRFQELIEWLGNLPIQRTHIFDNQRYCLSHAFFNEKIYRKNPNYSLENMFQESTKKGYNAYSDSEQILWYRTGDRYDVSTVPVNSVIVIGHTPKMFREGENLDLYNYKGELTKVICVDNGIAYQMDNNEMSKYVSGRTKESTTFQDYHEYLPSTRRSKKLYTDREYNMFIDAINATAKKYGIVQILFLIIESIYKEKENWYAPITNDDNQRENVKNIDLEKIKDMIEKNSKEKDIITLAENFVLSLINENETFKKIAETDRVFTLSELEPQKSKENSANKNSEERNEDSEFEKAKEKILKARFSDDVKEELIKQLEEEHFSPQGQAKKK